MRHSIYSTTNPLSRIPIQTNTFAGKNTLIQLGTCENPGDVRQCETVGRTGEKTATLENQICALFHLFADEIIKDS